jgi:hypothetical protein
MAVFCKQGGHSSFLAVNTELADSALTPGPKFTVFCDGERVVVTGIDLGNLVFNSISAKLERFTINRNGVC